MTADMSAHMPEQTFAVGYDIATHGWRVYPLSARNRDGTVPQALFLQAVYASAEEAEQAAAAMEPVDKPAEPK